MYKTAEHDTVSMEVNTHGCCIDYSIKNTSYE